jgi:hypothetical protein
MADSHSSHVQATTARDLLVHAHRSQLVRVAAATATATTTAGAAFTTVAAATTDATTRVAKLAVEYAGGRQEDRGRKKERETGR